MCQTWAEQYPLIKAQKIRQASLFSQEMGFKPAPCCGGEVWVCDHGPWLRSGITAAEDAVVFWRKCFRIPNSPNHYPYSYSHRHPQGGNRERCKFKSQGRPLLPSAILPMGFPKAQGKVKGAKEGRSKHLL